jgi:hypothetical protein
VLTHALKFGAIDPQNHESELTHVGCPALQEGRPDTADSSNDPDRRNLPVGTAAILLRPRA